MSLRPGTLYLKRGLEFRPITTFSHIRIFIPGWIKTYEKYYQDQVRHILDNMVRHLPANPKWKFMYAEVSFFAKWWAEQPVDVRETVMKLLSNGQGRRCIQTEML